MGRTALCAASSARPQQGRPGQSASGHHRPRGDARRHAGPVVGSAGRHCRRHHRGADQGRSAGLAARPLCVRRRCRHVFGREHGGALARSRPLYPGRADAQGEGDRARGSDPSGPLQAGCRQSPGQGGRGWRGRAVGESRHRRGEGERRRRYVLCLNPEEAERQRLHREQVLIELAAELSLLREREADHPKAACTLLASRRYGRYLTADYPGRPRLDAAKIKAAEKFDGKFVVITNDDTLSAEDVALGYKGGWIIESCFRRMKQTGLEVRPMFHWTPRRIEAHVRLCVLALQMQRAAEIRCSLPWSRIAHELTALKAVRYQAGDRTIVQRSKIADSLGEILKKIGISTPKQI